MIRVYNTMVSAKEDFVTLEPNKAGIYCCGPTTYNYIHLGNARPLVVFDSIRRYLEYKGYTVTYVQNFTDVDDKIIQKAAGEGIDPVVMAQKYKDEFFIDADSLNVKRATFYPAVSGHIDDIVDFIVALVNKGIAYEVEGDVYYSVQSNPEYGKLSKRKMEDLLAGARVDIDERKRYAADFALWKKAKPGEPSWESPWGQGRPGWHIECSAMSAKYLGESFDIHGGGYDLIFPHHENEIAQSEARFGKPMAKYWVHNGFITIDKEKMAKSKGNFFLLREVTKDHSPQAVRFFLLSTHYRSPLDFDNVKITEAEKGLERLKTAVHLAKEAILNDKTNIETSEDVHKAKVLMQAITEALNKFESAMDDDFNTALAIAALFDLARELNSFSGIGAQAKAALTDGLEMMLKLGGILGFELDSPKHDTEDNRLTDSLMEFIIQLRQEARNKKDFLLSDAIRDGLKERGILLEDTPQGAKWRIQ